MKLKLVRNKILWTFCIILILSSYSSSHIIYSSAAEFKGKGFDIGTTIEGEIKPGYGQYYTIYPKAVGELTITLNTYMKGMTKLEFRNAEESLEPITTSVFFDEATGQGQVTVSYYVEAKTYYVKVNHENEFIGGKFSIETKMKDINVIAPAKVNHSMSSAVKIGDKKSILTLLSFTDQEKFYCVDVKENKNLKLYMTGKDSAKVLVTIYDAKGNEIDSGWFYSNLREYSIDKKVPAGTYYIVLKPGTDLYTKGRLCNIIVGDYVDIRSIQFVEDTVHLYINESYHLNWTLYPEDATEKYTFSSHKPKIASITKEGKVKALKEGKAIIMVKTKDGGKYDTVIVEVDKIDVSSIKLNQSKATLEVGDQLSLLTTIQPKNASVQTVTWKSTNTAVATVDQKGKVTARGGGACKIIATCDSKSVSCSIQVTHRPTPIPTPKPTTTPTPKPVVIPTPTATLTATPTANPTVKPTATPTPKPTASPTPTPTPTTIEVDSISMISTLRLKVGDTRKLNIVINPSNATNQKVSWESTDTTIVTVDYGVITCKKFGRASIIVTAPNGVKAYCSIIVVE